MNLVGFRQPGLHGVSLKFESKGRFGYICSRDLVALLLIQATSWLINFSKSDEGFYFRFCPDLRQLSLGSMWASSRLVTNRIYFGFGVWAIKCDQCERKDHRLMTTFCLFIHPFLLPYSLSAHPLSFSSSHPVHPFKGKPSKQAASLSGSWLTQVVPATSGWIISRHLLVQQFSFQVLQPAPLGPFAAVADTVVAAEASNPMEAASKAVFHHFRLIHIQCQPTLFQNPPFLKVRYLSFLPLPFDILQLSCTARLWHSLWHPKNISTFDEQYWEESLGTLSFDVNSQQCHTKMLKAQAWPALEKRFDVKNKMSVLSWNALSHSLEWNRALFGE